MKVLFITCWYPTKENPGFGIFVHEHAKAVQRAGAEVRVLHIWPVKDRRYWYKPVVSSSNKDGIDVTAIRLLSRYPGLWYNFWPVLEYEMYKVLQKTVTAAWVPDILHGHVIYPAGFITRRFSQKLHVPYHLTEHWSRLHWVFGRPIYRKLAKKGYKSAVSTHPVSYYLKDKVREYLGDGAHFKVIPNVVDTDLFHFEDGDNHYEDRSLLCVTNFHEKKEIDKRPDLLIEALYRLEKKDQEKLFLTFIGPGEKQKALADKVKRYGLESRVEFLGRQPKELIAEKMRQADFLVHPTEKETFGVVVAEALCSGLPCIVSNIPALQELIGNDSGSIVRENTAEAWSDRLKEVANNRSNFNRRAIAEKHGQQFSYDAVGEAYMKAYNETLNARD